MCMCVIVARIHCSNFHLLNLLDLCELVFRFENCKTHKHTERHWNDRWTKRSDSYIHRKWENFVLLTLPVCQPHHKFSTDFDRWSSRWTENLNFQNFFFLFSFRNFIRFWFAARYIHLLSTHFISVFRFLLPVIFVWRIFLLRISHSTAKFQRMTPFYSWNATSAGNCKIDFGKINRYDNKWRPIFICSLVF